MRNDRVELTFAASLTLITQRGEKPRNVEPPNREHHASNRMHCIDGDCRLGGIGAAAATRRKWRAVIRGSHQICADFPLAAAIACIFERRDNAALEPSA